jgi:hypothetical protein
MLTKLMSIVNTLLVDDSDDLESATVKELESQPTFLYSKETLDHLKRIFPVSMWTDSTSIEQLAYNAGQQSIIQYIENRLGKESLKVINHVST